MGIIIHMKQRKDDKRTMFRALALVSQLGLVMIVSIGMTTAFGIWLDKRLGTAFFTAIFFCMGAVAGAKSAYRLITQVDRDDKDES